jgi:hypothetical protein
MTTIDIPETERPDQPSSVLLTMHRAGSKIAGRLIGIVHAHGGMPEVDLALMAGKHGERAETFLLAHQNLLSLKGRYFGPLRFPTVAKLGDYNDNRVILHVRDPRDCLVSKYFSNAFSHELPKPADARAQFLEMRKETLETPIDAFCLRAAKSYLGQFERLFEIAKSHPDVLRSRYEDMIANPVLWARRIARFAKVEMTPELKAAITKAAAFRVDKEDVNRDRRQVQPGDHLRKLKPETIAELTRIFRRPLKRFGYLEEKAEAAE